ncbi:hypothetical protein QFZ66_004303 [Streptomyces sp. B4I13]|uniref:hypothetical protein n=1 Tax=Streptomyces sp. B4I13 TaxID=3042271 RepID=UPI0027849523|nr:hypothetical protein [Streptomyces sp. B4I13]MDQ0960425.1 hypothetical protein [Streptomyces sp. B4I13]
MLSTPRHEAALLSPSATGFLHASQMARSSCVAVWPLRVRGCFEASSMASKMSASVSFCQSGSSGQSATYPEPSYATASAWPVRSASSWSRRSRARFWPIRHAE